MFHAMRASQANTSGRLSRWLAALDDRWPGGRQRAIGFVLALLIEAGLFLAILTLGQADASKRRPGEALTTVDFAPDKAPEATPSPTPDKAPKAALPRAAPAPRPDHPAPRAMPFPMPPPAAVLPVTRNEAPPAAEAPRIKAVVRDDMQGPVGPPDTCSPGDSQRVGSRPNGEPVYAARWYREPTQQEMAGYLSTADPGWALMTCKTEPEYRVDQCKLVDEWPAGSGMGRAVLASAWQMKVRPPQKGGRVLVGEWVRIRVSYGIERK